MVSTTPEESKDQPELIEAANTEVLDKLLLEHQINSFPFISLKKFSITSTVIVLYVTAFHCLLSQIKIERINNHRELLNNVLFTVFVFP